MIKKKVSAKEVLTKLVETVVDKKFNKTVLKEATNYTINDFKVGMTVTFPNGAIYKVYKPTLINFQGRSSLNSVELKRMNDIARKESVTDFSATVEWLNKENIKLT